MHPRHISKNLIATLRKLLPGSEVYGDDPDHGAGFTTWNATTARPLVRIECASVVDVQTSLRIAREFGLPLAVSGGRLDPFARTNRDGHLVLDLKRLNGVSHDEAAGTVTVQGGATTGDLLRALPDDVVTVTGKNAGVGVAGLTLGGGYGALNGRLGLACDALQSAQVVLADGVVVDASRAGDAELYWALRGGGTGFGVVTSLTLATSVLPRVLSATLFFPLSVAKPLLLAVQELLDEEPDLLGLLPLFTAGPDGQPGCFLALLWSGEPARGETLLRRLTALPGAQVLLQGWVPYRETLDPVGLWPWGRRRAVDTRTVERLDEPTVEILVEAVERMTSPGAMLFLHDFHGAAARIAPGATAFPLRTNHFVVEIVSAWNPCEEHEAAGQQAWMEETSARLAAMALPGGYVNFLSPEDGDRVEAFYAASADRLRRIKQRLDPGDIFRVSTGRLPTEDRSTR